MNGIIVFSTKADEGPGIVLQAMGAKIEKAIDSKLLTMSGEDIEVSGGFLRFKLSKGRSRTF